MLGNANNLVSESRREAILEAIQPSLKKYAKGDFTDAGGNLFGMKFKENLVQKVEADTALTKAARIASKGSRIYQNPHPQQKGRKPLFQGRTSGYGAAFGKKSTPYGKNPLYRSHQYQGKGKYAPGRQYHKKGSVFERLSPQERSGTNQ